MDQKVDDDKTVLSLVSAAAEELRQTNDADTAKKLCKEISPSQTNLRKSVGTKEATNYFAFSVENQDNI